MALKKIILGFASSIVLSAITLAQIPTNGLVGYYPFTGNANDSSGNAQNGTVYGATLTTDRFGNANRAYSFDGSTNYISVLPTNYLNNNYSYSYWLKSAVNPTTNGN